MSRKTSHKIVVAALLAAAFCLAALAGSAGAHGRSRASHRHGSFSRHRHRSLSRHRHVCRSHPRHAGGAHCARAHGRGGVSAYSLPLSQISLDAGSLVLSDSRNAHVYRDANALGGTALLMAGNDTASKSLTAAGAISQVTVRARGDQCEGPPQMVVRVDGRKLSASVASTTWHSYTAAVSLPAGTHALSIGYPNDRKNRRCDRNLRIDTVTVSTEQSAATLDPGTTPRSESKRGSHPRHEPTPTPAPGPEPAPEPTPTPTPIPSGSGPIVGLVSGAGLVTDAGYAGKLGASYVRVEFEIDTPAAQIEPTIARYADSGTQVLLLASFYGRIPSETEARNLATWAHAFGPGGTFWAGRSDGALAVRQIEFGNETSQSYQFGGCTWNCSEYIPRAEGYARALKAAQIAIDSPGGDSGTGLLAIGEDGNTGSENWLDGMFHAVPDLGSRIVGWTIHPYGPPSRWEPMMNHMIGWTQAHGAPATLPIYATEIGISSAGGTCLNDNFGWSACLGYGEAASKLHEDMAAFFDSYSSRLGALMIYQVRDQKPLGTSDRESYFGALQSDGSSKGAYTEEIRSLLAAHRA